MKNITNDAANIGYCRLEGYRDINTTIILLKTTIILLKTLLLHGEISPCCTQNLLCLISASNLPIGRQR